MRVLAHEPVPDAPFVEQHRITLVPLDQLLAESDFVSLHVPLSNESRHLIDARALSLMKPTAFLINTARGGLICEADLVRALRDGRIAGAGLDVFTEEPPPRDHPLTKLDNVICTAHTAGIDLQARDDMALLAAGAIVALRRGQWPEQQVINPECRAKFRWS
jgi:phosphoglycerate dehydrogenase-like enzyme